MNSYAPWVTGSEELGPHPDQTCPQKEMVVKTGASAILVYFLAFLASVIAFPAPANGPTDMNFGMKACFNYEMPIFGKCTSPCMLQTIQSANPPHGQWPAPMGSWRVSNLIILTIITPRVSDGCNSFDIVCLSVCLLPLSRPNGQTYGPDFLYVGQVEVYLGEVHRSRS